MMPFVFVLVLVLSLAAMWRRKSSKKHKRKNYHKRHGHTLDSPFVIHGKKEMAAQVRKTRCLCGGPLRFGAETQLPDHPGIEVASCECQLCEEKIRLYFVIQYLQ